MNRASRTKAIIINDSTDEPPLIMLVEPNIILKKLSALAVNDIDYQYHNINTLILCQYVFCQFE